MAEKVRAMQMIQGDVSAMSVDAQGNSLLVSDQRDQFFERLRGNAIYVRNGSLFASPPALPEDDLSCMRRGRLWALARECGVPKRALPALRAPAAAAARIRSLCGADTPARAKLLLLPRGELMNLCRRFTQRLPVGPRSTMTKAQLADRLLRLRWRGLPRPALEHALAVRLGRAVRQRSEPQARSAMVAPLPSGK